MTFLVKGCNDLLRWELIPPKPRQPPTRSRGLRRIQAVTMPRMRVCSCIQCPAHDGSCPDLSEGRRCPDCQAQAELRRGRRQARGYTAEHDKLRAKWKPEVQACTVHCHAVVCIEPARLILPGQAWDLGHTADRTTWTGPEHSTCNRSAGGKAAHGG